MSRSVRGPDYSRPGYKVTHLFQCYECSQLTPNLPDASGVALCDKHADLVVGQQLFCQEVHSEFRTV